MTIEMKHLPVHLPLLCPFHSLSLYRNSECIMRACKRFCGFGWESEANLSVIYLLTSILFLTAKQRCGWHLKYDELIWKKLFFFFFSCITLEAFKSMSGLCAAGGEWQLFGQNTNENIRHLHIIKISKTKYVESDVWQCIWNYLLLFKSSHYIL